jgi:polysaccharide export outer membrane protein
MVSIKHLIFILFGFILIASSCSYKKKNILFKTQKKVKTEEAVHILNIDSLRAVSNYKHRIRVGDRIQIRFLNNYDLGKGSDLTATSSSVKNEEVGYLVNYDSTVTLPLIGHVNIVGKDRLEAATFLETKYAGFISNPIIDVNIPSLTATVLGEVERPGLVLIDKENTSLAEVIALAGGFKDAGKKNNLKIIRGNEVIIVNMKMIESLKSPDIMIHHNDIVYVEPYGLKAALEPLAGSGAATALVLSVLQITLITIQLYSLSK